MINLFLFTMFISWRSSASESSSLQFTNGETSYRISKSRDTFAFEQGLAGWTIDIQDCNRADVDRLWNKLTTAAEAAKAPVTEKNAVVKFNDIPSGLLARQPEFKTLLSGDKAALTLRAISDHQCPRSAPRIQR